ncbi:hypothetical protein [Celeribacter sp.]|uniref:hypothetical protein n=1 Tax=Celeribacter sp. TaxID=1890673 RepID=UPI003A91366C
MGKKLTIHIGMGKTGSTAFQQFLDAETEFLLRAGMHYLGRFLNKMDGPPPAGERSATSPEAVALRLSELDRFAAAQEGIDHFIWSNEAIAQGKNTADIAEVAAAFLERSEAFSSVEILLVLRRQDEWLESAYRQWGLKHKLKTGYAVAMPEEFAETYAHQLDYKTIHAAWGSRLPTSVHVYDDLRHKGGIVQYFCAHWGLEAPKKFEKYNSVHGSLGPSQAHFVALNNRGEAEKVRDFDMRKVMRRYDLPELSDGAPTVPPALRARVLEAQRENNAALAATLGRDRLFHDRPVTDRAPYDNRVEDALTYLVQIARQQTEEIQRLRNRINKLEKKLGDD